MLSAWREANDHYLNLTFDHILSVNHFVERFLFHMNFNMPLRLDFWENPLPQTLQMKDFSLVWINKFFLKLVLSENSLLYTSQVV